MFVSKIFAATAMIGLVAIAAPAASSAAELNCKGCIGTKQLKKSAVTGSKVKNNSIRSADIRDGDLKSVDLSPTARPAVASTERNTNGTALAANTKVVSATIAAPGEGSVLSIAKVLLTLDSGAVAACSLTLDDVYNSVDPVSAAGPVPNVFYTTVTEVRVFPVGSAGPLTVNYICTPAIGASAFIDPTIVLAFLPATAIVTVE